MSEPSDAELADWLLAVKKRFVPGRTGYDWDDRMKIDMIAERLSRRAEYERAAEREACAKIAEGFDIEGVRNHGSVIARAIRAQPTGPKQAGEP